MSLDFLLESKSKKTILVVESKPCPWNIHDVEREREEKEEGREEKERKKDRERVALVILTRDKKLRSKHMTIFRSESRKNY